MAATPPRSEGRLYERIAAEIRQALSEGRYAVGDRLPSERDLAQKFGVVLFGKFVVDEAAQSQSLRQDLAHGGR